MEGVSMGRAKVVGATDKGLWVRIDDLGDDDVFIPYSQISDDSEIWKPESEHGELVVSEWLARERGWI